MPADHRVQLEAFEGPLDLLLYLIRKHEVDIHDIPVAMITERYLASLGAIDRVDIDQAGEFLVMAATLTEIKTRVIAAETERRDRIARGEPAEPRPDDPTPSDPDADPRSELVRQLLEYKKYRDAADALEDRRETWARRYPARPIGVHAAELRAAFETADAEHDLDLEELSLGDIVAAFERLAATVDLDRLGEHEVRSDETPIELHAEDIMDRLEREAAEGGQLTLFGVLSGRTRAEMVGLLLAMLDLVRQGRLTFRQSQDAAGAARVGDGIVLIKREPPADGDDPAEA